MKYDSLVLPIHGIEFKDIVAEFPQLKRHPEFHASLADKDKIIRFINYVYSANSEIVKTYKDDIPTRKDESAILAGLKVTADLKERLFMLKDDIITNMVVRFLIMQNNKLWTVINMKEQLFEQNILQVMQLSSSDDKEKDKVETQKKKNELITQNDKITKELEGDYEKLFQSNPDVEFVFQKKEEIRLNFTSPENVAKMPLKERY